MSVGPAAKLAARELALPLAALGLFVLLFSTGGADPYRDDAWISLRYARNLVEGHGLVFNPGERVEGFTNALWTLLGACVLALGLPPVASTKALGVLACAGLLVSAWRAAWEAGVDRAGRLAVAGVLAAAVALPYNGLSGLETMAYAACVFEALRRFAGDVGAGRVGSLGAGAFAGLAALLRPEGMAVFGLLWLGSAALVWRQRGRVELPRAAVSVVAFAVPVALWMAVRLGYYGDWVPNTYHAKVSALRLETLLRGLRYLGLTLTQTPTAPLLLGAALALRRATRLQAAWALGLALVAFRFAFVVRVGGDYMPAGRFVVAAVAPAALAWVVATQGQPRLRWVTGAAAALLGLAPLATMQLARDYDPHLARYEDASRWLAQHLPGDELISGDAVGAVGWFTGNPILDHQGLTDRTIATHRDPRYRFSGPAGHERAHPEYVLQQGPTLILLGNVWLRPVPLTADALARNPGTLSATDRFLLGNEAFLQRYAIVSWPTPDGRWFGAAVRRGSVFDPGAAAYAGPPGARLIGESAGGRGAGAEEPAPG